jgi:DNA polymerase-1
MDRARAKELFTRLEFSGFIKRFGLDEPEKINDDAPEVINIGADRLCDITTEEIVLDYEDNNSCFVIYDGAKVYRYRGDAAALAGLLEGRRVICHDCKKLYKLLAGFGVYWRGCTLDVMLAAYVVNSGDSNFELPRLVIEYLGGTPDAAIPGVIYIKRLADVLTKAANESGQTKLLYDIEMPLSAVLADMELTGFKVDCVGIREYGNLLDATARELEERIFYLAGGEFNINSPKQLADILFVRLGLPNSKKTKTGFSTNAEVLEKLRGHPIVEDILDYRKVTKLKSTYVEGLIKVADENSRVHTTFKQTGTATGRLSSTEPNLQNIPVRTELGRELRKFFIPGNSDYVLIDADYSQIELRLLANISDDETMIGAFLSGADIHTSTAATVFGVKPGEVTPELRKRAKAVNFGIMYGIGEFSLSQDLGISVSAAKRYIESYLASYPEIDGYLKDTIKKAYEDGYVTTMFGRRRYIPELKAQNHNLRSFGERVAMNSPIQGTAADIIKIAMINVSKRLIESGIDAKLILQVHDELLIESNKNCGETAMAMLKEEMESAAAFRVPLNVEINKGENWLDCK